MKLPCKIPYETSIFYNPNLNCDDILNLAGHQEWKSELKYKQNDTSNFEWNYESELELECIDAKVFRQTFDRNQRFFGRHTARIKGFWPDSDGNPLESSFEAAAHGQLRDVCAHNPNSLTP